MNKQELIEKIKDLSYTLTWNIPRINREIVIDLIEQLDEPQKPVVPQFVADHLKKSKEVGRDLQDAMNSSTILEEVDLWLYTDNNMDVFARSWLDGYKVEKEKRYLVKFIGMSKLHECLNFDTTKNRWNFFDCDNTKTYRTHHTRKELEEAGFSWVFDCEGVEVEEVKG